ncbi:het-s domain containing protein [Grosmannia clavigera kw1407]|uniref:Het-s domain containing protein n=1 Tax=Grosmannia clavigera (strain kw1407 / UAMH 11150) TaxID=655863 RepID=F0XQY2_GROCL|nr:het-s domain containing protein [Grosmannia clavigera kw1407]EFW99881.1 het-s domain containing protein [Grosmannia clavigera kw1407]
MAELALAVVGLAVAVPAIIEPTVRSLRFIRETLHKYRSTDTIQARLILQLDLHLVQVENLAMFIYGTSGDGNGHSGLVATLDPTSRAVLGRVIDTLSRLLEDFAEQLSTALDIRGGRVIGRARRLAFAFRGRSDPLQQLLRELESWERSFSNVVFSACLAAGRRLPTGLDSVTTTPVRSTTAPVSQSPPPVYSPLEAPTARRPIAEDLTELIQRCCVLKQPPTNSPPLRLVPVSRDGCAPVRHSGLLFHNGLPSSDGVQGAPHFLETHQPGSVMSNTDEEIRNIAAFLRGANPRLVALLPCQGFFVETEQQRFYNPDGSSFSLPSYSTRTLLFSVPQGLSSPRSLRDVLLEARTSEIRHSLDERVALMKKLASALLFIHTAEHIHKSIRADNVVLLREASTETESEQKGYGFLPRTSEMVIGEPFLVGFDLSRKEARHSDMKPTVDLHKTYYLPVDRQGAPVRRYSMLDDIYSLGVLFLEIALWRSLVEFEPQEQRPDTSGLHVNDGGDTCGKWALHQRLVTLAREDVARRMGSIVAGLVVACLMCLDASKDEHDNEWTSFGQRGDLADQDGIVLGQAYIRKVIMVLDTALWCVSLVPPIGLHKWGEDWDPVIDSLRHWKSVKVSRSKEHICQRQTVANRVFSGTRLENRF